MTNNLDNPNNPDLTTLTGSTFNRLAHRLFYSAKLGAPTSDRTVEWLTIPNPHEQAAEPTFSFTFSNLRLLIQQFFRRFGYEKLKMFREGLARSAGFSIPTPLTSHFVSSWEDFFVILETDRR